MTNGSVVSPGVVGTVTGSDVEWTIGEVGWSRGEVAVTGGEVALSRGEVAVTGGEVALCLGEVGMSGGERLHDNVNYLLVLYFLSYYNGEKKCMCFFICGCIFPTVILHILLSFALYRNSFTKLSSDSFKVICGKVLLTNSSVVSPGVVGTVTDSDELLNDSLWQFHIFEVQF